MGFASRLSLALMVLANAPEGSGFSPLAPAAPSRSLVLPAPRRTGPRRAAAAGEPDESRSLTQQILEGIAPEAEAGGAGGARAAPNVWAALQGADKAWEALRSGKGLPAPKEPFVRELDGPSPAAGGPDLEFDVVVCGGTLGVFIAAALAKKGLGQGPDGGALRVAVVERAPELRGRAQEWNLSMKELEELVAVGVLEDEDLAGLARSLPTNGEGNGEGEMIARDPDPAKLIAAHFKCVRAGYNSAERARLGKEGYEGGGYGVPINSDTKELGGGATGGRGKQELLVDGVLNLGVRPDVAIQKARKVLEGAGDGNRVLVDTGVEGLDVYRDGVLLRTSQGPMTARLVIDCMGHASPAVRQVRAGQQPDGVCVVVGTCASGFGPGSPQATHLRPQALANNLGDLIYTNEDMTNKYNVGPNAGGAQQYFWEAFPCGASEDLRTTYLFTYLDASPGRPSLTQCFEDYWPMLKTYQGIEADPSKASGFEAKRALFAFFPTFRESPLPSTFDRVLHAGDASGIQSPLSFGGFGALARHLDRISGAVVEALEAEALDKKALSGINPYMPNLAATWMFQRSMTARPEDAQTGERTPNADFVNRLLRTNFDIMNDLGREVMMPFLQDVVQFRGLGLTLLQATARDPLFIPQILLHVGLPSVAEWVGHFGMMGLYTLLHETVGRHVLAATSGAPSSDPPSSSGLWEDWAAGLSPRERFEWRRRAEAWEFGAGLDYKL